MQSVIIYRNPMEAAFWEMMMNGGGAGVMLSVFALGALWVGLYVLVEKVMSFNKRIDWRQKKTYALYCSSAVVAAVAIALVYNYL